MLLLCNVTLSAANEQVSHVYVVFKTHLDVGFTDLSSVVTRRYMEEFIPKAVKVSEELAADGSGDRYVWTTGSWLIWKYLQTESPENVARLEKVLRRGDIVWNGVPYTVESESMNKPLFETMLQISHRLDQRFGRKTIAAKMTDVPGHTRSIITPMYDAGIRMLHIGVNPASPIPNVPEFCRWRDTNGKELILVYQQDYGTESILPDGKTAISINFTGDNHGPHSYKQVKEIYANLRKRYPNAKIEGVSFNEVAQVLLAMRDQLPVVTSEIGDTWIYGYGSAPIRMAKFRKLIALYAEWVKEGKISPQSDEAINFAVELGLIAEHTQGMDIKTHLQNWDKYDMTDFIAARSSAPFRKVEQSWREIDDYLYTAIASLPTSLRQQAEKTLAAVDTPDLQPTGKKKATQATMQIGGLRISGLIYQQFDGNDFADYLDRYLRARYGWALDDIGKTGLDQSHAVSVSLHAQPTTQTAKRSGKGIRTITDWALSEQGGVDNRTFPGQIQTDWWVAKDGNCATLALTLIDKPAVRLPEAYWVSFTADQILSTVAEKVGERVDLMDVVERGNRQMHGIDRYVDLKTTAGTYRIWSEEALLVNVGEARGLAYSTQYPNLQGGIHFCLSNNLWGTNFTMWNEGSLTYHFRIEKIKE